MSMNHSHGKSKLTLKGVGVNDKPSEAEMGKREPLLEMLECAQISTITEESRKQEMKNKIIKQKTHRELLNI